MEMEPGSKQGLMQNSQGSQEQAPSLPSFPQLEGSSPEAELSSTNADLLERFVTNVMLLASDKETKQMLGIAKSGSSPQEALTKSMYFIIEAVALGLKKKGVQIPPELYLAKNGIIMESTKIIATILDANGIEISEQSVGESIVMVAQLIDQRVSKDMQGDKGTQQVPEGMHQMPDGSMMSDADMPQGQMPQGQMPQGQMPQGQMPQGQMPQGQMPQGLLQRGVEQ